MNGWVLPLIVVLALIASLAAFAFVLLRIIRKHAGGAGGWSALAARFATSAPMPAGALTGQTVQVGHVTYKRCVSVAADAAGLHLALTGIGALFGNKPLLIPWPEFGPAQQERLYWAEAWRLPVGRPELAAVTLPAALMQQARPWLAARVGPA